MPSPQTVLPESTATSSVESPTAVIASAPVPVVSSVPPASVPDPAGRVSVEPVSSAPAPTVVVPEPVATAPVPVLSDAEALSRRWTQGEGPALARAILERLRDRQPLEGLTIGMHEGRADLRGFVVPESLLADIDPEQTQETGPWSAAGRLTFSDVILAHLDLTGAHLDQLCFFDTQLRNCRFDDASCRDWRAWNLKVVDCSFRGADLRDSALGTWYAGTGNVFQTVHFGQADLRDLRFHGTSFWDADFGQARLDGVRFSGCDLVRCRFAGVVDDVSFAAESAWGDEDRPASGRLEAVDFSEAILRFADFRGLPLDRVRLPEDRNVHVEIRHAPPVRESLGEAPVISARPAPEGPVGEAEPASASVPVAASATSPTSTS